MLALLDLKSTLLLGEQHCPRLGPDPGTCLVGSEVFERRTLLHGLEKGFRLAVALV